jgi:hypothetical protein
MRAMNALDIAPIVVVSGRKLALRLLEYIVPHFAKMRG